MDPLLIIIAALLFLILIILFRIMNLLVRVIKMNQNTIDEHVEADDQLQQFIRERNIVDAVRRYRLLTGSELKEASDYVTQKIAIGS